jgi:hypothetical protein
MLVEARWRILVSNIESQCLAKPKGKQRGGFPTEKHLPSGRGQIRNVDTYTQRKYPAEVGNKEKRVERFKQRWRIAQVEKNPH